jgi:CHAD domain-containing protein
MREHRERELKFDVTEDWALPDLAILAPDGGSVERQSIRLVSSYYDTAGGDLLAHGVTLRRRTGDADTGWQLKLPAGKARTEVSVTDAGEPDVPGSLRDIVLGVAAGAPLRPVAELSTDRAVHRVTAADGSVLAEIADDRVSGKALGAAVVTTRWREVEVELVQGDEAFLAAAAQCLADAGARPATSTSKLARTLGRTPAAEGGVPGSLFGLVRRYLQAQQDALAAGDIELRRGRDVVHPTRVASRRFRSVLRELGDVFEPARAAALDEELKWYAEALGAVRDRQVLRAHLDEAVHALPAETVLGPVARRIEQTLEAETADAREALHAVLTSERYFALVRELRGWREAPPFVSGDRPVRAARRYVAAAERKVRKRLRRAPTAAGPGAALHRARKAAKRARYTAELAEPALGRPAAKTIKRMKKLQNRLGVVQDSAVAGQFLRRAGAAAGSAAGENGFTFGVLWEYERERSRRATAAALRRLR